jgi:hypothetical protein
MKKQGPGKQGSGVRDQGSEKARNRPSITAPAVKAVLKKLGGAGASVGAVEERLQIQTRKERHQIRDIVAALVRSGQAEIVMDEGRDEVLYSLTGKAGARGSVQAKLWEFACLRFATAKPFSAAEAARLAECDRDYTKRYCRWLWKEGYLAVAGRGRAGAKLYQVVGGTEHESAPAWNRRAEKRRQAGVQNKMPIPPCTLFGMRQRCVHYPQCMSPDPKRGERLDAALEDFGRALVEVAGGIGRAWEIIREMKGELLAVEGQDHGEPADGNHQS